jgi:hypothetical protein
MGERALARILGIVACAAFIWVGIGFAAFALCTVLGRLLGVAGAAALTALTLLVVPLIALALFGRASLGEKPKGADTALGAIAALAKDRPFLAMIGAAVFGAAEVLFARRRMERK